MIGAALKAKLAPYRYGITAGLITAVLCLVFWAGLKVGRWQSAEEISGLQLNLANANNQLTAQANLLREANAEAERAKREFAAAKTAAAAAEKAADAAEAAMAKREQGFAAELRKARRKPDCDQLLRMDVEAICGL